MTQYIIATKRAGGWRGRKPILVERFHKAFEMNGIRGRSLTDDVREATVYNRLLDAEADRLQLYRNDSKAQVICLK